jgi:hypothetical protein
VAPKNSIFLIFYRSISDRLPPLPQQQTPQSKNCDSLQTDSEVAAREFIISSISISKTDDSWFVTVFIDGVPVDFKVDTGAQCNVLPWSIFDNVVRLKQLKPGPRVMAYNRQPVRVVGNQQLDVVYKSSLFQISCVVAEQVDVPVLGRPSCKALNVVKLVDSLQTRRTVKVEQFLIKNRQFLIYLPNMNRYSKALAISQWSIAFKFNNQQFLWCAQLVEFRSSLEIQSSTS